MNILLTSAGRRGYMVKYFKQVLDGIGSVHVGNSSSISPAFKYADKSVVTPLIYEEDYIPFLKSYCQKNNITVVISLFDIDLYILSLHKEEFRQLGITVIVSDIDVISICNDKWLTYQFCRRNQIQTPKTYISITDAIEEVTQGNICYPLFVKPRWGMGSLAIYQADSEEELKLFYHKTKKGIEQSYLKYEANQDLEKSVIIQEKLCGEEYGMDIINDLDGNYRNTIIRRKYAMRSGETDCAQIVENGSLLFLGEKIGSTLKHIANMDVDAFLVNGEAYVLELNARFGGGYPFSHIAGANLPLAILAWISGEECTDELLKAKVGVLAQKDIQIIDITNQIEK